MRFSSLLDVYFARFVVSRSSDSHASHPHPIFSRNLSRHDAFGFFVFQGKDAQSPSFLFAGLAKYTQEDAAHQAEWEEYMASGAGLHDGLGQRLVRRGVPSR